MNAHDEVPRVPAPASQLTSTHWGAYRVRLEHGRVTALDPFERDSDPSPIGRSIPAALDSAARVRRPAIRRGFLDKGAASRDRRGLDPFVEVPWDEALDIVAAGLSRVIADHGNQAIFGGSYGWSSAGRFHHAQSQVHRFLNQLGGYVRHVGSYSLGAGRSLLPYILAPMEYLMGAQSAWPDLERHCKLFVAFGGVSSKNSQVSNGGASDHTMRDRVGRLARTGVHFVNFSPIRRDVAEAPEAEWHPIRPGTDTAVMLALAHTLLKEDLHDRGFLEKYCVGFEQFASYLLGATDGQPKDARWAAGIAQMDPEAIVELARRMARERTMINVSWSLQRADHGEQPYWAAVALASMLGQIGMPGGGIGFGYGAVHGIGTHASAFSGPLLPQGENRVRDFIPVARIADALLDPGGAFDFEGQRLHYPDLRLVYWAGGNAFHHHQDLNRLVSAWRKPECMVVHEQFWTAQAKHSDIVLPATLMLERDDIGSASRDRYMIAMKKAVEPVGEARDDYWIFSALAERLGAEAAYTEGRDSMQWLRHLYAASTVRAKEFGLAMPGFDEFWQHGYVEHPEPAKPAVLFEDFRADPEAHRLGTPSGKIELFCARIAGFGYADCPGHPIWIEPAEWLGSEKAARYPLHMISNQPHTKLHSQYDHGIVSLENKIQGREPVLMHPEDARARGIADGDVVRVHNDRGACLAGARFYTGMRPGVIQLATGAWYDPDQPGVVGALCKHGNANVLTLDKGASRFSQGCSAQTALVEVERFAAPLPPVTAFDPPGFVARSG